MTFWWNVYRIVNFIGNLASFINYFWNLLYDIAPIGYNIYQTIDSFMAKNSTNLVVNAASLFLKFLQAMDAEDEYIGTSIAVLDSINFINDVLYNKNAKSFLKDKIYELVAEISHYTNN